MERRHVGSCLDRSGSQDTCRLDARRQRAGGATGIRTTSGPRSRGNRHPGRSLGHAGRFVPSRRGSPAADAAFSTAAGPAVCRAHARPAGSRRAGVSTGASATGSERVSSRRADPAATALTVRGGESRAIRDNTARNPQKHAPRTGHKRHYRTLGRGAVSRRLAIHGPMKFISPIARLGEGSPVPCRRTFAPALQAFALSMLAALRHPWLRLPARPAPWHRQPLAAS
jgi:hypothetical protein